MTQLSKKRIVVVIVAALILVNLGINVFATEGLPQLNTGQSITKTSADGTNFTFSPNTPGRYKIELWGSNSEGPSNGQSSMEFTGVLLKENDVLNIYLGANTPLQTAGAGYQDLSSPYYSEIKLNDVSVAIAGGAGGGGPIEKTQSKVLNHTTEHGCSGNGTVYAEGGSGCNGTGDARYHLYQMTGHTNSSVMCGNNTLTATPQRGQGGAAGADGHGLYVTDIDESTSLIESNPVNGQGKSFQKQAILQLPTHDVTFKSMTCIRCGRTAYGEYTKFTHAGTCPTCRFWAQGKAGGDGGKSWYDKRCLNNYTKGTITQPYAMVKITKTEDVDYIITGQNQDVMTNVKLNTPKEEVIKMLGTTVDMMTDKQAVNLGVRWECSSYNPSVIGQYTFLGTLEPTAFVKNPNKIKAKAAVTVNEPTNSEVLGEVVKSIDKVTKAIYDTKPSLEPDVISVIKGKKFDVYLKAYKDTNGGSSGGVTVINTDKSDSYVRISGRLQTAGIQEIIIDDKKYVIHVIEEPDSSNVKVIFN